MTRRALTGGPGSVATRLLQEAFDVDAKGRQLFLQLATWAGMRSVSRLEGVVRDCAELSVLPRGCLDLEQPMAEDKHEKTGYGVRDHNSNN